MLLGWGLRKPLQREQIRKKNPVGAEAGDQPLRGGAAERYPNVLPARQGWGRRRRPGPLLSRPSEGREGGHLGLAERVMYRTRGFALAAWKPSALHTQPPPLPLETLLAADVLRETALKDVAAARCLCGHATWAVTSCQLSEGPRGVLAASGRADALW